jgi:methylenetetrahydrofolate dehydrogenase (NADP+)/methenyltetrahydrofolate cyclohydrolase
MMILKAKPLVEKTQSVLAAAILTLPSKPRLDVILIGQDPASRLYVDRKQKAAEAIGIEVTLHELNEDTSQQDVERLIDNLNKNDNCHGILIQLPLPSNYQVNRILSLVNPNKDVDGFHPFNKGRHLENLNTLIPCTALGVIRLLNFYQIELESKSVLMIGRSSIVGQPLAIECLHKNATVTIAHSKTKNIEHLIRESDIIISAIGKKNIFSWDLLESHQILVDIGIHRLDDGSIAGDFGRKPEEKIVAAYTPVPGGVGAMTVNTLMYNIVKAYCLQKNLSEQWLKLASAIDKIKY